MELHGNPMVDEIPYYVKLRYEITKILFIATLIGSIILLTNSEFKVAITSILALGFSMGVFVADYSRIHETQELQKS
ncbi:MAG: hypothetical protein GYA51_15185 [Candidatus Methanofastidiosa archaeon]|jgi:hypothetical protein|nr:hypothetical protein [Candidatus Methanofastidiosa archaeon]